MLDLADVRGQNALIPALEVAAAGGHNLFMHGPPGTGKTMLARRLPSILPPMTAAEAVDVTRIHSVAGLHDGDGLVRQRPFRAPHHTISASGLVGGGSHPLPGRGDARPPRRPVPRRAVGVRALEPRGAAPAARGRPRHDRARAAGGGVPDALHARRRLQPVPVRDGGGGVPLHGGRPRAPPAPALRPAARPHRRARPGRPPDRRGAARTSRRRRRPRSARVIEARERQSHRLAVYGLACNAQMTPRVMREVAPPTPSALRLLYELHDRHRLSARGHTRVLRVARTVADLDGSDVVGPDHVHIAAGLRLEQPPWRPRHERVRRLPAPHGPDRGARRRGSMSSGAATRPGGCSRCPTSRCSTPATRPVPRALRPVRPGAPAPRIRDAGLAAICRCDDAIPRGCATCRPARRAPRRGRPGGAARRVGRRRRRAAGDGVRAEVARELGRGLSAAGVTVVSGLALGVDSAAHAGALEGTAAPVAVLAGGADRPYPASKRQLHAAVRRRARSSRCRPASASTAGRSSPQPADRGACPGHRRRGGDRALRLAHHRRPRAEVGRTSPPSPGASRAPSRPAPTA